MYALLLHLLAGDLSVQTQIEQIYPSNPHTPFPEHPRHIATWQAENAPATTSHGPSLNVFLDQYSLSIVYPQPPTP